MAVRTATEFATVLEELLIDWKSGAIDDATFASSWIAYWVEDSLSAASLALDYSELATTVKGRLLFGPEATPQSAATVDLGALASHVFSMTAGSVLVVTSFGNTATTNNPVYVGRFAAGITLTHNATSLISPTGADILSQANDFGIFLYLGSGNWRILGYWRADGSGLGNVAKSGDTMTGLLTLGAGLRITGGFHNLAASEETLTIASGAITVSRSTVHLLGEGGVADFLVTINGGSTGDLLTLRVATNAYGITLRTGGNIGIVRDIFLNNSDVGMVTLKKSASSYWNVVGISRAGREVLYNDRDYYVRTDGNDTTNDGLANTAAGAFLTIQQAVNVACKLDFNGFQCRINVADGTYTGPVTITIPWVGGGALVIRGNITTPANCIRAAPSNFQFLVQEGIVLSGYLHIRGFKLAPGSGSGIAHVGVGQVYFSEMDFGSCNGGYHLYAVGPGAKLRCLNAPYTISGPAGFHMLIQNNAFIEARDLVVTLTGTPAWANAFLRMDYGAIAYLYGNTYSGAATGARFDLRTGAIAETNGSSQSTYFPGNSAGAISDNALYK